MLSSSQADYYAQAAQPYPHLQPAFFPLVHLPVLSFSKGCFGMNGKWLPFADIERTTP